MAEFSPIPQDRMVAQMHEQVKINAQLTLHPAALMGESLIQIGVEELMRMDSLGDATLRQDVEDLGKAEIVSGLILTMFDEGLGRNIVDWDSLEKRYNSLTKRFNIGEWHHGRRGKSTQPFVIRHSFSRDIESLRLKAKQDPTLVFLFSQPEEMTQASYRVPTFVLQLIEQTGTIGIIKDLLPWYRDNFDSTITRFTEERNRRLREPFVA